MLDAGRLVNERRTGQRLRGGSLAAIEDDLAALPRLRVPNRHLGLGQWQDLGDYWFEI